MAKTQRNGTNEQADAKAEAEQPKAKARARTPKPFGPCACGCGDQTRSTWAPGHDAKLYGVAHRYKSGRLDDEEAKLELAKFPEVTVKAHKPRLLALAPNLPVS